MNPELRRNVWLELPLHRVLRAAAVIGLIFFCTSMVELRINPKSLQNTAAAALSIGAMILVFFGMRSASTAVSSEIQGRTWDFQRMSSLGAWSMTWGKLIGSTSYALLCLAICSVVFLLASAYQHGIVEAMRSLALYLVFAALALSFAFVAGLSSISGSSILRLSGGAGVSIIGGGLVCLLAALSTAKGSRYTHEISWYGMSVDAYRFILASLFVFCGWCVLGSYRLIRVELQLTTIPWVWGLFVIFGMIYTSGLVKNLPVIFDSLSIKKELLVASFVALATLYYSIFNESKSVVNLRRLKERLTAEKFVEVLQLTPRWCVSLALYAITCMTLALFLIVDLADATHKGLLLFLISLSLFVMRDIGIVMFLGYGPRGRRAPESFALLLIALLYTIIPAMFCVLSSSAFVMFYPIADPSYVLALLFSLIQAVVVWFSVYIRLRSEI